MCGLDYERFELLGVPQANVSQQQLNAVQTARTWQDLCRILGIDYEGDLARRAEVKPFFRRGTTLTPEQQVAVQGREGRVMVRVDVAPDGTGTAYIAQSSGDATMDRIGFAVASSLNHEWLPGLRYGKPVLQTIVFSVNYERRRP